MSFRTNATPAMARAARMAGQLFDIPAVRQLVEEEEKRRLEASKEARVACINRMIAAEQTLRDSRGELNKAASALADAETRLVALRVRVCQANENLTSASRIYSAAAAELSKTHGEGALQSALMSTDWLIRDCDNAIKNLQANQFDVTDWGRKFERPGVAESIKSRQERRVKAVQAKEALQALRHAPIAPEDLAHQVEVILGLVGLAVPKVAEEVVS